MKQGSIERSILATILYYDCLDWPLTTFELWARLIPPLHSRPLGASDVPSLAQVALTIETSVLLKQCISHKHGFWFIRGRSLLVNQRIGAMKESEEKLKRIFLYRWLFTATPFLYGAFVSGSVAGGRASKKSDIDILVVTKQGRIWTTRFFLTLFTTLAGVRRKGKKIKNRVCLNHYITNAALEIPFHSLYNAHTYLDLIPLINRFAVFERFFDQNAWVRRYVTGDADAGNSSLSTYSFPYRKVFEYLARIKRSVCESLLQGKIGDGLEHLTKRLQWYLIRNNPLTGKSGGRIQAQDFQLEFHPQSKERIILEAYRKRLNHYKLKEFWPEQDSGLR